MTTLPTAPGVAHAFVPSRAGTARTIVALGAREGALLVRHPLHLVGVGLTVAVSLSSVRTGTARGLYFDHGLALISWDGILTFFASHHCATRARRAGAMPLLRAAATPARTRTAAHCLATLGPFLLSLALLLGLDGYISQFTDRVSSPGAWRLLGAAMCVLGAGLLGVCVAERVRLPGAAAFVMVAVIAACVALYSTGRYLLLQPYSEWAPWDGSLLGTFPEPVTPIPGSPVWHVGYLAGLCALATCGALVGHRHWRTACVATAIVAAAFTGLAGLLQLP